MFREPGGLDAGLKQAKAIFGGPDYRSLSAGNSAVSTSFAAPDFSCIRYADIGGFAPGPQVKMHAVFRGDYWATP